jgi:trans-aconitate 2-methyltransferase
VRWDPEQYLQYADERGRPFFDLLARVDADDPRLVVDLGCGPGNLTRTLVDRWPGAHVLGIDSSVDMVSRANAVAVPGRLDFVCADLRDWTPTDRPDVIVSNATLQWVPDHSDEVARWTGLLAPAGWLAFQVPGNFDEPSHTILHELADDARWRSRLSGDVLAWASVRQPPEYLTLLADLGLRVDAWETTYLHVLPGDDAVLEWLKGTGARPVLEALDEPARAEFLAEYGARLRSAYPKQHFGTVRPFRRIFVVAQRGG